MNSTIPKEEQPNDEKTVSIAEDVDWINPKTERTHTIYANVINV